MARRKTRRAAPARRPRRRIRDMFKRAPRRSTAMSVDNTIRGVAGAQAVVTVVADPIEKGIDAYGSGGEGHLGQAIKASLKGFKEQKGTVYFKAMTGPISAEAGIGTKNFIKRGMSKAFGLLRF